MTIRLFQLNIFKGFLLEKIIKFAEKNDFDLYHFQEVAGYDFSRNNQDDYQVFKKALNLNSLKVNVANPVSSPRSFFANATYYKNSLTAIKSEVVWLKNYDPKFIVGKDDSAKAPRAALLTTFETGGTKFISINGHLTWGPTPFDEPYKIKEDGKLLNRLKKIKEEFVLSGDFNLVPQTTIVKEFSKLARNLCEENNIKFTLNPNIHFLKEEAVKRNLAVDYIFVSPGIKVKKFELVTEDLSDHYGLILEFEI